MKAWSGARAGRAPALDAVDLREIEVVDDGHGRPALELHGDVAAALESSRRARRAPLRTHLSLSHDPPTAAAVVMLERLHPSSGRRTVRSTRPERRRERPRQPSFCSAPAGEQLARPRPQRLGVGRRGRAASAGSRGASPSSSAISRSSSPLKPWGQSASNGSHAHAPLPRPP